MQADSTRPVMRRVLFIDGFQPRGASALHGEYQQAAQARGASGDVRVEVGPRSRLSALSDAWTVHWHSGSQPFCTHFEVLRWDDIVRRHWPRAGRGRTAMLVRDAWRVWAHVVGAGVFARMRKLSFPNWALAVFPGFVAALGALWITGAVALTLALGGFVLSNSDTWPTWAATGMAWILFGALLIWKLRPHVPSALWLLRLISFTYAQSRDELPDLELRIAAMAERTAQLWNDAAHWHAPGANAAPLAPGSTDSPEAPDNRPTELLLVGYSTGAILVPLVVARARALLAAGVGPPQVPLAILTLGHCTPMLSLMPEARAFRAALAAVAGDAEVAWVDYSAAPDVAACARVPPWWNAAACGLKRSLSPRFHRLLPAPQYAALRRDLQALHRQYLKGPAQPLHAGDYDFISLTAGPTPIRARFAAASADPT